MNLDGKSRDYGGGMVGRVVGANSSLHLLHRFHPVPPCSFVSQYLQTDADFS